MSEFIFKQIGTIYTPYDEKFGIPRAPGLVPDVEGRIVLEREYSRPGVVNGLENFSHIWVFFLFSENLGKEWVPCVRPPRLGGNKKKGVFATRSPLRPNFMGMSALELISVREDQGQVVIIVKGPDILNGTPIIDIKPYIPENDSISGAHHGWTVQVQPLEKKQVFIANDVQEMITKYEPESAAAILAQISQILSLDPRPSYFKSNPREGQKEMFAFKYSGFDLHFEFSDEGIFVVKAELVRKKN